MDQNSCASSGSGSSGSTPKDNDYFSQIVSRAEAIVKHSYGVRSKARDIRNRLIGPEEAKDGPTSDEKESNPAFIRRMQIALDSIEHNVQKINTDLVAINS